MTPWNMVGRGAGVLGAVVGVIAAGAAVGAATERALVGRRTPVEGMDAEGLGRLRGDAREVITDDGIRLHVEVDEAPPTAPDDGLTLVFCHGYALQEDAFHFQRRDLRGLARLVFYDQRSHGRSERGPADGLTIDRLGTDLRRVLEAVVPEGPIVLVGHSMGGMTIMALADQCPELFGDRVLGVALIATSAGRLAEVPLGLPSLPGRFVRRAMPGVVGTLARNKTLVEVGRERVSDLGYWATRSYAFGSDVDPDVAAFAAAMIAATPIDVISEFLPALDTHDKAAALATLHGIETLVMVGESDKLTPPEHSEEIVHLLPDAEFVRIPDTGHLIELERYPEVNMYLRRLVNRVRRYAMPAREARHSEEAG